MFRSFEFRLRPTKAQIAAFEEILVDSCETYNAALQERRDAWKMQRKVVTDFDQFNELQELRKDPKFAAVGIDIAREPIRRVDSAFQGFFRRAKAGQKPGYPRFRSRDRYDSFAWYRPSFDSKSLMVPKVGRVKFTAHQLVVGESKKILVKRQGRKWIARVVCDIGSAPPKQPVSSPIGVDLGLTSFAVFSNGDEIKNPRFAKKAEQRITNANRALARKLRGSKNRLRAKERLRREHQRVADARKNFCHHASKAVLAKYDLVAHEALNIADMAEKRFGKSIMDAAWGLFLFQLTYKAESAGRWVVPVNPRNTTKQCSSCGELVEKKIFERTHSCKCGLVMGRDHNAAVNILRLGRSLVKA